MPIETIKAKPNDPVHGIIQHLVKNQFPTLAALVPELRIAVQYRVSDKDGKPALKCRGYPALAVISVVSLEDRLDGAPDVRITIDKDRYDRLTPKRQEATICHELRHIQFPGSERDENECVTPKLDSAGRPKVGLCHHDWELGGFDDLVQWYGDDAIEHVALEMINERVRQMEFRFEDPDTVPMEWSESRETITAKMRDGKAAG